MRAPVLGNMLKATAGYGITLALCLGILTWVLQLWRADLAIPIVYSADAIPVEVWTKTMIENGWYLHNDLIGAPAGADMHDYPVADSLHLAAMKVLALVISDNYAVVCNLYFLLGFPLAALSMLFVLRRFNVSWGPAGVTSLLFAFMPYHFTQGLAHLYLASYYLIPLIVMVIFWQCQPQGLFASGEDAPDRGRLRLLAPRALGSLLICLLVASAGVYYAFFACFFLLVAGLWCAFARRQRSPAWTALLLTATIGIGVLVNLAPSFLYMAEHGVNREAVSRSAAHADLYALRITHLLRPSAGHRLAARYGLALPQSDDIGMSLGVVAALGFVLLIGRLLYRRAAPGEFKLMDGLCILNTFGVLLATRGSFGYLFSLFVSPWIRCYYRISIYLAFFGLFAAALVLERLARHWAKSTRGQVVLYGFLALLLVGGILDETTRLMVPPYEPVREIFQSDARLVQQIEASVPHGSMIFQLPYASFPEGPVIHQLCHYELLTGYLHSTHLRWSYGSMKGRDNDRWLREVSGRSVVEMVAAVTSAGFRGIYVDRFGYTDHGVDIETRLARILHRSPLVSLDNRKSFFPLGDYSKELAARPDVSAWAAQR